MFFSHLLYPLACEDTLYNGHPPPGPPPLWPTKSSIVTSQRNSIATSFGPPRNLIVVVGHNRLKRWAANNKTTMISWCNDLCGPRGNADGLAQLQHIASAFLGRQEAAFGQARKGGGVGVRNRNVPRRSGLSLPF